MNDLSEDEELERLKRKRMEEIMAQEEGPEFPDSPIHLTDDNFQDSVDRYPLLAVDFWAEWCAPCKAMEPIIEKLAKKFFGKIVFGKINIDQNQFTSRKFRVSGIPALVVIKKGEPVDRIVGMAPVESLEQRLRKHLD